MAEFYELDDIAEQHKFQPNVGSRKDGRGSKTKIHNVTLNVQRGWRASLRSYLIGQARREKLKKGIRIKE